MKAGDEVLNLCFSTGNAGTFNAANLAKEELLEELMRSSYLFDSVPYFFAWASSHLRTQTAAKKKSTGKAGRNKKS